MGGTAAQPGGLKDALSASVAARNAKPPAARVRTRDVTVGDLVFNADFDSGGLSHVSSSGEDAFTVWTRADCEGTGWATRWRRWFCFSVRGAACGRVLRFEVRGMNPSTRLFAQGMRPVYRSLPSQPEWTHIAQPATATMHGDSPDTFAVSFAHEVGPAEGEAKADDGALKSSQVKASQETLYFAFCFPFGYAEIQARLGWLEPP